MNVLREGLANYGIFARKSKLTAAFVRCVYIKGHFGWIATAKNLPPKDGGKKPAGETQFAPEYV